MMETCFGGLQIELLDRRIWDSRAQLATSIFEVFYNAVRRHSTLGCTSPIDYERLHTTANGGVNPNTSRLENREQVLTARLTPGISDQSQNRRCSDNPKHAYSATGGYPITPVKFTL